MRSPAERLIAIAKPASAGSVSWSILCLPRCLETQDMRWLELELAQSSRISRSLAASYAALSVPLPAETIVGGHLGGGGQGGGDGGGEGGGGCGGGGCGGGGGQHGL